MDTDMDNTNIFINIVTIKLTDVTIDEISISAFTAVTLTLAGGNSIFIF